jgi:serine/threonine protein kinase
VTNDTVIAGKFRIDGELGRGGMGVVDRAEDMRLKRTVALKFLPPGLVRFSEVRKRSSRTASAAEARPH